MSTDDLVKVLAALTPIILGILALQTEIARRNAVEAGKKTDQVAATLVASTSQTSEKLDTIHTLVNSRLTKALEKIDALESRLFETEGRVPTGEEPVEATGS